MKRTPDDQDVIDDDPNERERIVERIVERNGNGSYSRLKDLVFTAIILGAGGVIWAQQSAIDSIKTDIAVLKLKCSKQPVERGAND